MEELGKNVSQHTEIMTKNTSQPSRSKRAKRWVLLCVCAIHMLTTLGCFRTGISPSGATAPSREADISEWHHHFLFGAVAGSDVTPSTRCEYGILYIKTRLSFSNIALGFVTLGLYYPSEVQIWCREKALPIGKPRKTTKR